MGIIYFGLKLGGEREEREWESRESYSVAAKKGREKQKFIIEGEYTRSNKTK